jgi:hypothetical protein
VYRYMRTTDDRGCARHGQVQQPEALIAVNVINRMPALGMPAPALAVA